MLVRRILGIINLLHCRAKKYMMGVFLVEISDDADPDEGVSLLET